MKYYKILVTIMAILLLSSTYIYSQTIIGTWNMTGGTADGESITNLKVRLEFGADDSLRAYWNNEKIHPTAYYKINGKFIETDYGNSINFPAGVTGDDLKWIETSIAKNDPEFKINDNTLELTGTSKLLVINPPVESTIYYSKSSVDVQNYNNTTVITNYNLYQNYPNPFNPSTSISFEIPNSEYVNLSIYNVSGQKVRTLINGYIGMGTHSINWNSLDMNGNKVVSGIYIYRLKTKNYSLQKKMLLTK